MSAVLKSVPATPEPLSVSDLIDMLVIETSMTERRRIGILLRMRVALDEYSAVLEAVTRLS